jgi:hypothetical protein
MHQPCLSICVAPQFVTRVAPECVNKLWIPHLERVEDGSGVIADVNNNDGPHCVVCLGFPQLRKTNIPLNMTPDCHCTHMTPDMWVDAPSLI